MAELLVRTHFKMTANPFINAKAHQRGDVVMAAPDGHDWRPGELTHPEWRIMKFPQVSMTEAEVWLSPELPTAPVVAPESAPRFLQARGFRIELDLFPEELQEWLRDDSRAVPSITLDWSAEKLRNMTGRVAPIKDPYAIGG